MLNGLVFGRSKRGGHSTPTASCDALFSRVKENNDRESLSIRIHQDVMRRLRWMLGDYVMLRPEDNGQKWVVYRVPGPKEGGLKLSRSGEKSSQHATVRFSVEKDVLEEIFKTDDRYFTATLCDSQGNEAIFLPD
jgi:hypothetical protein